MTVQQLLEGLDAKNLTPEVPLHGEVSCGYACDLLSFVMAHGQPGMAWVTVQTHLNVIAVAVLLEFSCILLPEGVMMEAESLKKAAAEGVPVLQSGKTAYNLCGEMMAAGIPASKG